MICENTAVEEGSYALEERFQRALAGLKLESEAAIVFNEDRLRGLELLSISRALLSGLDDERFTIVRLLFNATDTSLSIPTLSEATLASLLDSRYHNHVAEPRAA